jgi:hypothetical protein
LWQEFRSITAGAEDGISLRKQTRARHNFPWGKKAGRDLPAFPEEFGYLFLPPLVFPPVLQVLEIFLTLLTLNIDLKNRLRWDQLQALEANVVLLPFLLPTVNLPIGIAPAALLAFVCLI